MVIFCERVFHERGHRTQLLQSPPEAIVRYLELLMRCLGMESRLVFMYQG